MGALSLPACRQAFTSIELPPTSPTHLCNLEAKSAFSQQPHARGAWGLAIFGLLYMVIGLPLCNVLIVRHHQRRGMLDRWHCRAAFA